MIFLIPSDYWLEINLPLNIEFLFKFNNLVAVKSDSWFFKIDFLWNRSRQIQMVILVFYNIVMRCWKVLMLRLMNEVWISQCRLHFRISAIGRHLSGFNIGIEILMVTKLS